MEKVTRLQWVLFLGIVGLAGFLRLVQLDQIPPGLWYDEAIYALDGLSVAQGNFPVFFETYGHMREPLYIYSLGGFFALFGQTTWHARVVSALWGTTTVALLFPLARHLVATRWALLACLSLAVFRWHLHFSRTIFRALLPSVFIVAVVLLFLRWRNTRKPVDAALCGGLLGLGMYTYLSFRLVPLILVAGLLWMLWKRDLNLRRDARQLAAMVGATFLVFLPLGIDYLRHPGHFTGRTSEITLFEKTTRVPTVDGGTAEVRQRKPVGETLRDVGNNALSVAKMWTIRGDHVAKHNLPHAPVFDWASGLVFYAGLGWCLWHAASHLPALLLLVWLGAMSLTSVLSFGAPNLLRMQGASPAVILIYVLGMKWLFEVLSRHSSRQVCRFLVAALVCSFAAHQLYTYFVRFPASLQVRQEFQADSFYGPAEVVRTLGPRYPAVLVPQEMADAPTFKFVTAGLPNVVPYPANGPPISSPKVPTLLLLTSRSNDLARQAGQDVLAKVQAGRGTLLRKMSVPVQEAPGAPVIQLPWAEFWAIPPAPVAAP